MARFTPQALASLLEKALGREPAQMLIEQAIETLKQDPNSIETEEALAILDEVAGLPGLPGVCARFAKARLHLVAQD